MIRDHQWYAVVSMPAATQFAHGRSRAEQTLNSDRAERDQHAWLNNLDLFDEIWPACMHLCRRGRAIPKTACRHIRAALQDICNVNVFARQVHRLQDSRQ